MAYWAEVLEVRMNLGGIGQKGGRGCEKDGKISIRVVVILEVEGGVGRCHDMSDLDCERLKRGCNEADTHLWENHQLCTTSTTTTGTQSSLSLSISYVSSSISFNLQILLEIFFHYPPQRPLLSPTSKCSLDLWFTCEPRLARILRQ
jgi:hypothetical protein